MSHLRFYYAQHGMATMHASGSLFIISKGTSLLVIKCDPKKKQVIFHIKNLTQTYHKRII